jgi:hypothetical protein
MHVIDSMLDAIDRHHEDVQIEGDTETTDGNI